MAAEGLGASRASLWPSYAVWRPFQAGSVPERPCADRVVWKLRICVLGVWTIHEIMFLRHCAAVDAGGHLCHVPFHKHMRRKRAMKSTSISAADARRWGFSVMSSIDNPKASKATKYGFLNAILYMAPSDTGGAGNVCVHAGACVKLCLGENSGQAQIRKEGEDNSTTLARKARIRAFMTDREKFMEYVVKDISRLRQLALDAGLKLVYRFNGSTDIGVPRWVFEQFPDVTFIDYTKNPNRMAQYLSGKFTSNYHLTFSYDRGTDKVPSNERLALRFLSQGGNVAVVFGTTLPPRFLDHPVIDGDANDIRTPEMDGRGVVVGLVPKGNKAKRDMSGFVVRDAA